MRKSFTPMQGSHTKPQNNAPLVGAAPRGEWRPSRNIEAIPKSFAPKQIAYTKPSLSQLTEKLANTLFFRLFKI